LQKNNSLSKPLTSLDLNKVYRKDYHIGCRGIRERLSYIEYDHCAHRFKTEQLKDSNILIKNIRVLTELSNTQRGIVCLLGTVFTGENPSINKIAETTKMNYSTVKKQLKH